MANLVTLLAAAEADLEIASRDHLIILLNNGVEETDNTKDREEWLNEVETLFITANAKVCCRRVAEYFEWMAEPKNSKRNRLLNDLFEIFVEGRYGRYSGHNLSDRSFEEDSFPTS